MMTNGPAATVGEIVSVDLPRPRKRIEVDSHPTYLEARHKVLEFLYAREALRAA
jgi:nitrate/nitrite transport system ATP-binding protein